MVPDYKCNAVYFSSWLKSDYPKIYQELAKILNRHNVAYDIIPGTKDIWCRDYMPLQIDNNRYLNYSYKPDYLVKKPCYRKYITDTVNICRDMSLKTKKTSLIIDGGNVVKVGNKVIMTEKVFVENQNIEANDLKDEIEKQMECEVIFIPWDREEIYGHSDGIVKPISDNAVLMTNYHDFDDEYTGKVRKILSAHFDIAELSYNVKKPDPRNWAYINFLSVGNLIVLPALDIEEDELALSQIRQYYPDCIMEQLNISNLIKKGGGLNCVSWCRYVDEDRAMFLTLYNRNENGEDYSDKLIFTQEEIIFMCRHSLRKFADRYPGIAEYYMKCLDD